MIAKNRKFIIYKNTLKGPSIYNSHVYCSSVKGIFYYSKVLMLLTISDENRCVMHRLQKIEVETSHHYPRKLYKSTYFTAKLCTKTKDLL